MNTIKSLEMAYIYYEGSDRINDGQALYITHLIL